MILNQPFPAYNFSLKTLRLTLYAGIIVFLVLVLFRPFNFKAPSLPLLFAYASLYGLVAFIITSANALFVSRLSFSYLKEEHWTVGKEMVMILWQIITVSLGNILLTHYLYGDVLTLKNVINWLGITAAVGIFPVGLMVLLKQQLLLKKYSAGAIVIKEQLIAESPVVHQPEEVVTTEAVPVAEKAIAEEEKPVTIIFTGENQNERLEVPLNDIRYITSADNYIKVFYVKGDKLAMEVLRSSLKKAEETVANHPQLFRCHRTYIVNLAVVDNVSGNAQGYKLHIKNTADLIPVSRSLNKELYEHIEKYKQVSH